MAADLVPPFTAKEVLEAGERGDIETLRSAAAWVKHVHYDPAYPITKAVQAVLRRAGKAVSVIADRQFTLEDVAIIKALLPDPTYGSHLVKEGTETDANREALVALQDGVSAMKKPRFWKWTSVLDDVQLLSENALDMVKRPNHRRRGGAVVGRRDPATGAFVMKFRPYHNLLTITRVLKHLVFLLEEGYLHLDDSKIPDPKPVVRSEVEAKTTSTIPDLKPVLQRVEAAINGLWTKTTSSIPGSRITDEDVETALDLVRRALATERWSVLRSAWVGAVVTAPPQGREFAFEE